MEKNKLSIITVVKNSKSNIEKTINSVLDQNYKNLEYIIIDGGSKDGTLDIIDKYKDKLAIIVSENDNGIWDAMNKGIKLASGDVIGFLNSGDIYYSGALNTVNKYFLNHEIDFIFGSVHKYKLMHGFKPWKIKISFGFYTSHSIGFFIKTLKHKKVGFYNNRFLSADLDFFYKMIVNCKLKGMATKSNEIFGKFEAGGFSSKVNYIDHLIDLNKIRINNNQNKLYVNFIFILKILKRPVKFLSALKNKNFKKKL